MLALDLFGNTTERSVWELQVFLKTVGAPLTVDKTFGAVTQRTWNVLAADLKLDPLFERVSDTVARVNKDTYEALRAAYVQRKAPGPAGSNDFERLNNAINKMDYVMHGNYDVDQLSTQWANLASGNLFRSIQSVFLPIQVQSMQDFWQRYSDIYRKASTEQQVKMAHPSGVRPGGFTSAFHDLWTPALDSIANAKREAAERAAALLQQAGKEVAKGASEEGKSQALDVALKVGGAAVGVLLLYKIFKHSRRAA